MAAPPSKTQLKVNALSRLLVEYKQYVEEESTFRINLSELENASPIDEYEIKRAKQILEETQKVRARVLQSIRDRATEVKQIGGPETKTPKAVDAIQEASKLK